jgi:hypothetical protein
VWPYWPSEWYGLGDVISRIRAECRRSTHSRPAPCRHLCGRISRASLMSAASQSHLEVAKGAWGWIFRPPWHPPLHSITDR